MTDTTLIQLSRSAPRANPLGAQARLATLRAGVLRIREGNTVHQFGARPGGGDVTITVLDPAFYAEIAFGGSVGAAESYMLGHWRADDLTALMRLLLRNRHALDAMETGLARVSAPLRLAAHWLHRNTRTGSRRNISAHYFDVFVRAF
jgi:cyclopropane-fatty-acyl-phospholipid synthase